MTWLAVAIDTLSNKEEEISPSANKTQFCFLFHPNRYGHSTLPFLHFFFINSHGIQAEAHHIV